MNSRSLQLETSVCSVVSVTVNDVRVSLATHRETSVTDRLKHTPDTAKMTHESYEIKELHQKGRVSVP